MDWIGVYPDGTEPGSVNSTIWLYVDGTTGGTTGLVEGSVTFAGGLNLAGDWVAYLLVNDGYTKAAETKFRVVDPSTPFTRLNKALYAPGESISVAFTNGPGNAKDWIGVYPENRLPGERRLAALGLREWDPNQRHWPNRRSSDISRRLDRRYKLYRLLVAG